MSCPQFLSVFRAKGKNGGTGIRLKRFHLGKKPRSRCGLAIAVSWLIGFGHAIALGCVSGFGLAIALAWLSGTPGRCLRWRISERTLVEADAEDGRSRGSKGAV